LLPGFVTRYKVGIIEEKNKKKFVLPGYRVAIIARLKKSRQSLNHKNFGSGIIDQKPEPSIRLQGKVNNGNPSPAILDVFVFKTFNHGFGAEVVADSFFQDAKTFAMEDS
jgi:hypothetical protein